jgi:hypothetical protein
MKQRTRRTLMNGRHYSLFEQKYKQKLYYHLSLNKFDKFKPSSAYRRDGTDAPAIFLTTSKIMLKEFSRYLSSLDTTDTSEPGYLYICYPTRELDMFNPSSRRDMELFKEHISKNPSRFFAKYLVNETGYINPDSNLSDFLTKWVDTHFWRTSENAAIVLAIKNLGFDGYISQENGANNLAVFDGSLIKIHKCTEVDWDSWDWLGVTDGEAMGMSGLLGAQNFHTLPSDEKIELYRQKHFSEFEKISALDADYIVFLDELGRGNTYYLSTFADATRGKSLDEKAKEFRNWIKIKLKSNILEIEFNGTKYKNNWKGLTEFTMYVYDLLNIKCPVEEVENFWKGAKS